MNGTQLKLGLFCIASILLVWVFYGNFETSWSMAIKVSALAGLFIIAVAFLIGSLSYFFPERFSKYRAYRKFLGLSGFFIILIHVILSLVFYYKLDFDKMFYSNPKVMALYSGIIAFLILLTMALTSTDKAMKFFTEKWGGYGRWKTIQTMGYFALALSLVHVFILETKPDVGLKIRPLGLAILVFSIIVLAARIGVIIASRIHEHDFR